MFPRLGIFTLAQANRSPEDFWPPRTIEQRANLGHAPITEPVMLLRLAGVVAVIALIVTTALMAS